MEEMKMQDIVTIAAGEARAEALLDCVRHMIGQYSPDVKLIREILSVAEPEKPEYLKKYHKESANE